MEIDNLARFPPGQDFDEVFIRLKTLREEGWFREIGVCDLNVESLAYPLIEGQIVDIAVIETEVSLWSSSSDIRSVISWSLSHRIPHPRVFSSRPRLSRQEVQGSEGG